MIRNTFACLVHERSECVLDLVRNLRCLDPDSSVLLYNGGSDPSLLDCVVPLVGDGVFVHPGPQPMRWGTLHGFALDCMRFGLEELGFDTMTIVDSDQLCVGRDYSKYLSRSLAGRSGVGMLCNEPDVQPPDTRVAPAANAWAESDLWRPFLKRFDLGEEKFLHWSFWPTTVFLADAAAELLQLFEDPLLQQTMARSRIWATEEVVLPTLVSLLGFELVENPCRQDYVKFRAPYSAAEMDGAMKNPQVYWVHPIPRRYDDPLRVRIRESFEHYRPQEAREMTVTQRDEDPTSSLLLIFPILERMRPIEGWFEEDEADLLIATASGAAACASDSVSVVEIGSYCGRATVVLGSVLQSLGKNGLIHAIDPHDGVTGARDQGLERGQPTFERFQANVYRSRLDGLVRPIRKRSFEVDWEGRIDLLLIDGLHDYASVSQDFHHFYEFVEEGGLVIFHDYADYYPGVMAFVDELLLLPDWEKVACVRSLMVVRRCAPSADAQLSTGAEPPSLASVAEAVPSQLPSQLPSPEVPLVSCIMPTADRPGFVAQAMRYFERQDYPNRELIIVDDGSQPIGHLISDDPRVQLVRLEGRRSMGWKHNLACERAKGDIVVHWDDDDWYANWRISYQVKELRAAAGTRINGLSCLLFYAPAAGRAWRYDYPMGQRAWVCGNTFCYWKSLWDEHRFTDSSEGADTRFVWSLDESNVRALPDERFLVAIMHGDNTSPKRTSDPRYSDYSTHRIRELIGTDWSFYEGGAPMLRAAAG